MLVMAGGSLMKIERDALLIDLSRLRVYAFDL